jgi:DUF4097 and DUF4098 domain-containing protein YvlB
MDPTTFTTPHGLRLELRIPAGSIEVETADTAETTLQIDGERDPSDFRVELTELSEGGHRLLVEQHRRRAFVLGGSRDLRVRVRAPLGSRVQADTGSADFEARGEIGSLAFRSGSGDVAFDRVSGDVTVKVASGDVEGKRVDGDLSANSASGDIRIDVVGGDLVARSASGEVEVDAAGGSAHVSTASGDIGVGGLARGEATFRSVSGDIDVTVMRGTSVWLDLSSVSGDAVSDLAMGEGSGNGGAALEVRAASVSGDIHVRSADRSAATS